MVEQFSPLTQMALFPMAIICSYLPQRYQFRLGATCQCFWVHMLLYTSIEHLTDLSSELSRTLLKGVTFLILTMRRNQLSYLKEFPQLQQLTLKSRRIWIGDAGASGLGAGLKECRQLQQLTLDLGGNSVGAAGASGHGADLKECQNLQQLTLTLEVNHIGEAGASGLGDGLKECRQLQQLTLDLRCNQIGATGVSALRHSLKECPQLTLHF